MWWRIDLLCPACNWTKRDHFCRRSDGLPVCEQCGVQMVRAWLMGSFPNIIGDDVPGGFVAENMTAQPETFYSKSAWRRRVKELGLRVRDEHQTAPGSNRNARTRMTWGRP